MAVLTLASRAARRFVRDPVVVLLVVLGPLVMVLVMAAVLDSSPALRIGLVVEDREGPAGSFAEALSSAYPRAVIVPVAGREALRDGVERGRVELGVIVPAHFAQALAEGRTPELEVLSQDMPLGTLAAEGVGEAVMTRSGPIRAARFLASRTGWTTEEAARALEDLADVQDRDATGGMETGDRKSDETGIGGVVVSLIPVGQPRLPPEGVPFGVPAQGALVLFVFLAPLLTSADLREMRRSGVLRRIASAPVRPLELAAGEALGRAVVALLPAVVVIAASSLLLGVSWGDPSAVALLVAALASVAAAAAVLAGTIDRDAAGSRARLVSAAAILGLLGGAVVPLELMGGPLGPATALTPHAWTLVGLRAVAFEGAGASDVAGRAVLLGGVAAVLVVLGAWRLRRSLGAASIR
jgi:ABC-2 type transport system permease protein